MSAELSKERKLPTIAEITADVESAHKSDELNLLLSQQPPAKWVKEHPFIKGYKYLPIDKIEYLLRKIFKQYRIEITGQGTSFNGVWVTVRVHYLNPVLDIWSYHDGIGASQLQTKKDTSPSDMININNGAIAMAFPLAKTVAIKDACDMFGDLFGANLNRRDTLNYTVDESIKDKAENSEQERQDLIELYELKHDSVKEADRPYVDRILKDREVKSYTKLRNMLMKL